VDGNISEQQQVEEIKKWLHENGMSILIGLVVGLSAVFGWRAWDGQRHDMAQQASAAYTQMVGNYKAGKPDVALREGGEIVAKYGKTSYATFSALLQAGIKIEMGDTTAAIAHLKWAVDNAQQVELKQLAMLRLARLLLAEKKIDEALRQAEAMDTTQYAALRAELLGDLYRAKGDLDKARGSYQDALKAIGKGSDVLRASISMKLDAIGGAPAAEQAS
jgi:predicted negative regulator of RcsB-dependent stress response